MLQSLLKLWLLLLPIGVAAAGEWSTPIVDDGVKRSVEYLLQWLPERDAMLSEGYLIRHAEAIVEARRAAPWALDDDIYYDYILPYASVDERRDNWSPVMCRLHREWLAQQGQMLDLEDTALYIAGNLWKFWNITFVPQQTPLIMSPWQTVQAGFASCTGLSIFLVDSYRSVGIPARLVGTPLWNNLNGGNHDWVEVWLPNKGWSFMDAFDGRQWNQSWFIPNPACDQMPNSGNISIYATSWKTAETVFPLAWNFSDSSVHANDVTASYLNHCVERTRSQCADINQSSSTS